MVTDRATAYSRPRNQLITRNSNVYAGGRKPGGFILTNAVKGDRSSRTAGQMKRDYRFKISKYGLKGHKNI